MATLTKAILITALVIIVGLSVAIIVSGGSAVDWVCGEYGSKCYIVGQEHGNIEYKVYFKTYGDCLKYLESR